MSICAHTPAKGTRAASEKVFRHSAGVDMCGTEVVYVRHPPRLAFDKQAIERGRLENKGGAVDKHESTKSVPLARL